MYRQLALAARHDIEVLPPDVVPDFIRANHVGMHSFLIPAVLLLYDSRKFETSFEARLELMTTMNSLYA